MKGASYLAAEIFFLVYCAAMQWLSNRPVIGALRWYYVAQLALILATACFMLFTKENHR